MQFTLLPQRAILPIALLSTLLLLPSEAAPLSSEARFIAIAIAVSGESNETITSLDLSNQDLRDLSSLPDMPALKSLDLSGNLLTSVAELSRFPALEELSLADNPLLDTLDSLPGLPITSLDLSNNAHLADLTPLGECPNLERLVIREYGEDSLRLPELMETMPVLPSLREFEADEPETFSLDWAQECPLLESVRLHSDDWHENYNNVVDLAPLKNATHLRVLDLGSLGTESMLPLAGKTDLEELRISFPAEGADGDVTPLSGFTKLRRLDISSVPATDLHSLTAMTQLESLSISIAGPADLTLLPASAPLRELTLQLYFGPDWTYTIGGPLPAAMTADLSVLSRYPQLEKLHLTSVAVDPDSYAALTTVKDLAIGGYRVALSPLSLPDSVVKLKITQPDQTVIDDVARFPQLKELYLQGSIATDYAPLSALTQLEVLEFNIDFVQGMGPNPPLDPDPVKESEMMLALLMSRTIKTLDWLAPMTALRKLSIEAPMKPIIPVVSLRPLGNLTKLESLTLQVFGKSSDIDVLANLTQLRHLDCYQEPFASLAPLGGMPMLESVSISAASAGTSLEPLRRCPRLKSLELFVTPRGDDPQAQEPPIDLTPLESLTHLERLELGNVVSLEPLRHLYRIQHLLLSIGPGTIDLTPLVENPGINRHDRVWPMAWDPSPEFLAQAETLLARGVDVRSDAYANY